MSKAERMALPQNLLDGMREDYDFAFVFGESDQGNTPPLGFTRAEVAELYAIEYGENDGPDWWCVGRLGDGRYLHAVGYCDYTGWDCQAANRGETWDTWEAFIANVGDEVRSKMGAGLDGLGSTVTTMEGSVVATEEEGG